MLGRPRAAAALRGRASVPADGEGRNSVFLAELGHHVVATDIAPAGIAKAGKLAAARGVSVELRQLDLQGWQWPEAEFDAVVAVFIQFARPAFRDEIFAGMRRAVRPGGVVLLHGYTPRHHRRRDQRGAGGAVHRGTPVHRGAVARGVCRLGAAARGGLRTRAGRRGGPQGDVGGHRPGRSLPGSGSHRGSGSQRFFLGTKAQLKRDELVSYRSRQPLRVKGEVTDWQGHLPEALKISRWSLTMPTASMWAYTMVEPTT